MHTLSLFPVHRGQNLFESSNSSVSNPANNRSTSFFFFHASASLNCFCAAAGLNPLARRKRLDNVAKIVGLKSWERCVYHAQQSWIVMRRLYVVIAGASG